MSFKEKTFWIVFTLLVLIVSGFFVQYLWDNYQENPTLVTADTADISISAIKFPGISVCSINKISKRKAQSFAEYLFIQDNSIRYKFKDKSKLLEAIKLIANLYDFNVSDKMAEANLQTILDRFDNLTKPSDLLQRITELALDCDEILLQCKWGGTEYNCNELLENRATFDGNCCVFNYIARSTSKRSYGPQKIPKDRFAVPQAKYPPASGVKNGLQLVLKDNLDDYFATTMETTGYKVSIFNPMDYPDKTSGSLSEVIANSGNEVFISITAVIIQPTSALRALPIPMRKCIFSDERSTDLGHYRQSDCLEICKVRIIKYICQCIPFFHPIDNVNYCTLIDLPCLHSFQRKWNSYYPTGENTDELHFEITESIYCEECYPACNDEIYEVSVAASPILINATNNTYVYVYFDQPFGTSYKRDVTQTWFELISSFGGSLSLMMGLSFISFAEILAVVCKLAFYF